MVIWLLMVLGLLAAIGSFPPQRCSAAQSNFLWIVSSWLVLLCSRSCLKGVTGMNMLIFSTRCYYFKQEKTGGRELSNLSITTRDGGGGALSETLHWRPCKFLPVPEVLPPQPHWFIFTFLKCGRIHINVTIVAVQLVSKNAFHLAQLKLWVHQTAPLSFLSPASGNNHSTFYFYELNYCRYII